MTEQYSEAFEEWASEEGINNFHFNHCWAAWQAALASVSAEPWQPIETAPETGEFLVYMPEGEPKIQAGVWHPNIKSIGNHLLFDMWPATQWMPLPAPPTSQSDRSES